MPSTTEEFQSKFQEKVKSFGDITHPVWSGGSGQPIILMHELDGFIPAFMKLALRLGEAFTVHTPVFYGRVGQSFSGLTGYMRAYFCMRREFEVFRLGRTSPIAGWVRSLAQEIHHQSDAQGVGVVGMCMTGGIVLATISHPSVAVGVAAQPSLPLASFGSLRRKEDLGMYADDVQAAAISDTPVMIMRYGKDKICPAERMPSIERQIPTAQRPPGSLEMQLSKTASHPTLTDAFRKDTDAAVQDISELAVDQTINFLSEHLRSKP